MGKTWIFFFEYIVLYIICKEWFTFAWNGNILLKIYVSTTVNETVLAIGCCLGNQNTMRQPCWMFDVFCTDKFWVLYIYLYTNWSQYIYIYYLLYNYVHLYTHSNHSNTQRQRRKLRVWAGGLNRTQKTPLDMERIFRSNWCFYHGWHESFYFDEKRKYIQWKQTQQKTPMEFKVW